MGRPVSIVVVKTTSLGKETQRKPKSTKYGMSGKKIEEVTVQGLGIPVPVGVSCDRTGTSRPSASYCSTSETINEVCLESLVNPFERRDSLCRTPPRMRASSLTDIELHNERSETLRPEDYTETSAEATKQLSQLVYSSKRKKPMESPEKQQETTKKNKIKVDTHQSVTRDIQTAVEQFGKILGNMYKPKLELKEVCSKLEFYSEKLKAINHNTQLEAALEENDRLKCELSKLININLSQENAYLQMKEELEYLKMNSDIADKQNETKCKECENAQKNAYRKNLYKKEETYCNYKRVEEGDWEGEMFTKFPAIDGNIWEASMEDTIVIPCSEGLESKEKAVSIALNKFGGRDGLKGQRKKKGEVAFMTQTLGFPNEEGEMIHQSRAIFYPLVTDTDGVENEEDTFKSLQTVKRVALNNGWTNLATVERTGTVGETWKRMLQYIFDGSKIHIKMYKLTEASNRQKKTQKVWKRSVSVVSKDGNASDTNTDPQNVNNNKQHKFNGTKDNKRKPSTTKVKQDALLVKAENKSYSDILQMVRSSIDPEALGVEVKTVGKTRKGDLLVTVTNGENKTHELKNEIQKVIPDVQVSVMTNKKILHLKGMEEAVTAKEILETIAKETQADSNLIEVRAIRPAFGGRTNATVILPSDEANKLIQRGKLKIGWTFCRILERKKDPRCLKCWEYGHQRDQCPGPDRDNLCRKCTKEGHKAASCKGKPFCIFCMTEGHLSNTRLCKRQQNFQ